MSELELIRQQLEEIRNFSFIGFKDVLSVSEACIFMGLSKSYLYKLCQGMKIKHFRSKEGKIIYFRKKDLTEWMLAEERMTMDEIDIKATKIARTLRRAN